MSSEFYAATADAIEKFVAKFRNLEEWDDALLAKIEKLETRDGLRTAAIAALRDAGRPAPSDAEVEDVIAAFVRKGFTARRQSDGLSAPAIDWSRPVTVHVGRKVLQWDPATQKAMRLPDAEHPAAPADDVPTRDVGRRLEAHSRHLRNIDARLKRVEHDA